MTSKRSTYKKYYVSVNREQRIALDAFIGLNGIQNVNNITACTLKHASYTYLLSLDEPAKLALILAVNPEWVREALW